MITELRCSSLPRNLSCPASLQAPEIEIDETGEYAPLGTAVHEMMAALVMGERLEIADVALKHGVESDELAPLYHMGRNLWLQYAPAVDVIGTELEASVTHARLVPVGSCEIKITGHCDVLAKLRDTGELVVFDWKSGTMGRNYRDQIIGYAWQHGATKAIVVWLRDRVVDVEDVTQDDIMDLNERIEDAYANPNKYAPSDDNCMYCPRRFEPCPALMKMQRATVAVFAEGAKALTPEQAVALYPKVQFLEKAVKAYRDQVRSLLEAAGGPMPLGDGRELALGERTRDTLNPMTVIDVWDGHLSELASALKVGKGALTKILAASAERGEKGKVIEAFLDRLREAGGIETRIEKMIQVRKSLSKKEEKDDG